MKKRIVSFALVVLLSVLFTVPAQGLDYLLLRRYLIRNAPSTLDWANTAYLGTPKYWTEQIEKGNWTGENRPEALMGDANIDGKVNATDALFALHFSVYGNIQTSIILSNVRTPPQMRWESKLTGAYNKGTQQRLAESKEFWLDYCRYNSPFFADVTKDCIVNAKDALEILKYCVGKAKNFPEGDFTSVSGRFAYYPWPTEYYPGMMYDLCIDWYITDQEFCEKHNFYPDVSPTDQ